MTIDSSISAPGDGWSINPKNESGRKLNNKDAEIQMHILYIRTEEYKGNIKLRPLISELSHSLDQPAYYIASVYFGILAHIICISPINTYLWTYLLMNEERIQQLNRIYVFPLLMF